MSVLKIPPPTGNVHTSLRREWSRARRCMHVSTTELAHTTLPGRLGSPRERCPQRRLEQKGKEERAKESEYERAESENNMNVIRLPRCQSATVASIMYRNRGTTPVLSRGRNTHVYVRWESFDDCTASEVFDNEERHTLLLRKSVVVRLVEVEFSIIHSNTHYTRVGGVHTSA